MPIRSRLYVVCSDANAVAVMDISEAMSSLRGFVPTGWYPTAVRAHADGRLVVLNGRGLRSYAESAGPEPYAFGPRPSTKVGLPTGGVCRAHADRLRLRSSSRSTTRSSTQYTKTVIGNSPYRDEADGAGRRFRRATPCPRGRGIHRPSST